GIDEAYVSYLFPLGKGLLVKAGKMTALAGAEVAEEKDNWNISRSFLCAFSSPFTNTGVRAQYTFNEMFDLTVGAHRGWDICFQDNNSVESYEARLGMNLTEKFNVALCVMRGAEQDKNDSDQLSLLDLVATYKFTDKLTGMLNADIGMDEHAAPDGGDAYWNGLAAYLKYDWTEKFSVAARAETFHDPDGVCTGEGQTLAECTLTAQYKFRENLWGRIEYRRDSSNADVFLRGIGMSENQNTIAASLLFTF
ncbi:MAG: outer membrane beta-barrel protein, partial [Candidatus Sumerlaeota bacterium]|nr:outer membrane beta-barrel protein [Candidatus Sumerlaeota bacterium]